MIDKSDAFRLSIINLAATGLFIGAEMISLYSCANTDVGLLMTALKCTNAALLTGTAGVAYSAIAILPYLKDKSRA